MGELKKQFGKLGFKNVKTVLASGNVIFDGEAEKLQLIPDHLDKSFGFKIPVITIPFDKIEEIIKYDPFGKIEVTPKTRLYVTFLATEQKSNLSIPFTTDDGSFSIIRQTGSFLFSVLDLEKTSTVDAMNILEKEFGKNITTRNYNTVQKIAKL